MTPAIDRALLDLGYTVDYSPFLSWWIYPLLVKQWWSLWGEKNRLNCVAAAGYFYPLKLTEKHLKCDEGLTKIPLPTVNPFSIPVWHTGWFIFWGEDFSKIVEIGDERQSGVLLFDAPGGCD